MEQFDLVVVRKVSAKSQKTYVFLGVDLGYRIASLTFDVALISELSNISIRNLNSLEIDKVVTIGNVKLGK